MDASKSVENPDWAKDITKTMAQMKLMMKEKGIKSPMDYTGLDLDEGGDPLPQKFKFLNIKKYSGTDDPHLHLKQYVTYMRTIKLTKPQIVKQFPLSLEGSSIHWYNTLEPRM